LRGRKSTNNNNDVSGISPEMEKEQEKMLERGRGRMSRAQTMLNGTYNFSEVLSNLRRKREELAKFTKKIKKDAAKLNAKK
jgi:hypothetical protein